MPAISNVENDGAGADPMLVWTEIQTIATCIGLVAIALTVGTLIHQRHLRLRDNDPGRDAADPEKMGIFVTQKPSYWRTFLGSRIALPSVPSVGGLIKAGDAGLWTSGAFSHVHTCRGETTATGWVPLAETTLCNVSWLADLTLQDMGLPEDVLAYVKGVRKRHCPAHSDAGMYQPEGRQLVRCIRPLDRQKRTTVPSGMESRVAACEMEKPWLLHGSLCVSVSASETVALATILGMPLEINDYTQKIRGIGAFGSSLGIGGKSPPPKIELSFRPHWADPVPPCSSGYTTVMAKSIAFGCVPFAENDYWVNAIYVSEDVLSAIKTGRAIADIAGYGGTSMQYLWQLPAAKGVSAYFHPRSHWVADGSRVGVVETMNGDAIALVPAASLPGVDTKSGCQAATWQRAVAGIAFGGLVPQASSLLAEAVAFTVGGVNLEGCINHIEDLINDLYDLHPGTDEEKLRIFGTYVQSRCRTRDWIETDNWTRPVRLSTPWAAFTFHRYMNLLEVITASLQGWDTPHRMEAVFQETSETLDTAYKAAVKAHLLETHVTEAPAWKLTDEERQMLGLDLGDALLSVRGKLKRGEFLTTEDVVVVVRCILAAWAAQVPVIRWKNEMLDSDLGPLSTIPSQPCIRRLAVVGDLPQSAGLG